MGQRGYKFGFFTTFVAPSKERCPSGLRSAPGKCVYLKRVSGVRIPLSPQDQTKQEDLERDLLVFYVTGASLLADGNIENKKATKVAYCVVQGLQGPRGERKGKVFNGASQRLAE